MWVCGVERGRGVVCCCVVSYSGSVCAMSCVCVCVRDGVSCCVWSISSQEQTKYAL